ncbi:GEVED domain-containing protein [Aquimarina sp. 2201CG5-10]|uniref:GEVED domain-containing protein n=1 Tax=Aquimarina callyspongiae TaxID=3098150 RepID=UPI002AB38723|nr:GEVED domain-containing protein [Aquimarina sp. 2201CG5-10]MDY8137517.1 GEVED domain-containing protein [Aquimarina sp. 2201CG5-10]
MNTNIFDGRILLPMIFLALSISVNAQSEKEVQQIRSKYDLSKLQKIEQDFLTKSKAEKQEALKIAKQRGWEEKVTNPDGSYMELQRIENGRPIYYGTHNVAAARSTRANHLNSGGSLGLNLMGQNMTAYVWDGGVADRNHQEYDGAGGSNRFTPGDGSSADDHAAHVTGTIMASGFTASAKGMAPHAKAIGYDWNSDLSEATSSASNGMLVSNHSYGLVGMPASAYGAYIAEARDWDQIMYNAPNYLVVTSAGNNGTNNVNNNPVGGVSGYDKMMGRGAAKNSLTVANAQDANIDSSGNLVSVSINSGSSQGPTDDLRIKPDITGNGTNVYSSLRNNTYGNYTGTSMSAPNVTGSLLLLQQHHRNTQGSFMKAATLKGLALHTADDAGANGPDPIFGWGLMNTKRAAETITQKGNESRIEEVTLNSGQTYTITVNSDNTNPLLASISWTDRAGTVNNSANVSTPVLINDLDIRVSKSGTTYSPWRLTGVTTNGRGDNRVDPYERVDITGASGTYTITVTHKGNLTGGSQAFSLIVTGVTDTQTTCTPTVPSGVTASSITGSGATISWSAVSGATYDVRYRQTGTSSWTTNTVSSTTTTLSGLSATTQYEVQVRSKCTSGNSNYSSSVNFTTTSTDVNYCAATATNGPDAISNVSFGNINNSTTRGANGYQDHTSISTNVSKGASETLTVTIIGYQGGTSNEVYAWFDWNQDGDFSDSGEAFTLTKSSGTVGTSSITIPNTAASGATRMRVRVGYNAGDNIACGAGAYGEVEDYTINVGGGTGDTQAPSKPTNLVVTSVTNTEVNLSWTASTDNVGVTGYEVYRDGINLGTTTNGDTTARVFNLSANTTYTFYVIAIDAAGNKSTASDTVTATTTGGDTTPDYCTPSAGNPSGQHITNVTIGSINNNSGAGTNGYTDYTSQSTSVNGSTTLSVTAQATWPLTKAKAWVDWNRDGDFDDAGEEVLNGSGSATNRTYTSTVSIPSGASGTVVLRVRASYSNDPTPCGAIYFSDNEDYTLNVTSSASNENLYANTGQVDDTNITVYPNPVTDFVTIKGNSLVSYRIVNAIGQTVQKGNLDNREVNVSDLSYGVYTIVILNDRQKSYKSKIVKK